MVIAIGSRVSRDIDVPGPRERRDPLAMDYLYQRNRWVAEHEGRPSRDTEPGQAITAAGKRVIVIGGGDTGMDCISNALREGATSAMILDVYAELRRLGPAPPVAAAAQAHDHDLRARGGRQAPLGHRGHRLQGR